MNEAKKNQLIADVRQCIDRCVDPEQAANTALGYLDSMLEHLDFINDHDHDLDLTKALVKLIANAGR